MFSKEEQKIGFIASCFDPFPHPGVVVAMQSAVATHQLTGIVAAVHDDPSKERDWKSRPYLTLQERVILVSALRHVRYVRTYQTEDQLLQILKETSPDVRILGEDYIGREQFTGSGLEIPIFYAKRYPEWSGTEFRKRIRDGIYAD